MDDKGRAAVVSVKCSSLRSVRLWRMLTGQSAIPIDAAMHKRSAENVSTMANDGGAEEGGRLLKPALLLLCWLELSILDFNLTGNLPVKLPVI